MLPVFVVKVAEIAVGLAIGNLAGEAVNKVPKVVKKVVEQKKKGKES